LADVGSEVALAEGMHLGPVGQRFTAGSQQTRSGFDFLNILVVVVFVIVIVVVVVIVIVVVDVVLVTMGTLCAVAATWKLKVKFGWKHVASQF
jgi:hypothetical protein